MKFKLLYSSTKSKIAMTILHWFTFVIIDIEIAFFINLLILVPNFSLLLFISDAIYGENNAPEEFSYIYFAVFFGIQFLIIAIVEIKRRFLYVKVDSTGILVYNNNLMKFDCGKWYRRNVKLRYYDIECCYKCNGYFLPKTHISEYWFVKAFRRIENAVYSVQEREYKTAIAFGRYNADCIFLDLKNGKTAVLPIKDCDTFLAEYEKYAQRYM